MAREKEGYRENLELLNNRFPGADMLTVDQVMEVTGWRNYRTINKYFGDRFTAGKTISKVFIAAWMCGAEKKPRKKRVTPFTH